MPPHTNETGKGKPQIFIGADHAGFLLKSALVSHLRDLGYAVEDLGAPEFNADDDYPDFITPCAERVAATPDSFGVIIGSSGQGEAMAANRTKGIRAGVFYGEPAMAQTDTDGNVLDVITSLRRHNDANMLSLGAGFLEEDEAKRAVERFISTPFSGEERHKRRISKF